MMSKLLQARRTSRKGEGEHKRQRCVGPSWSGKKFVSTYNDLIALARLCLRHASTARTTAAAEELQRLAKEYEDRAASLGEGASLPSNAQPPSHGVQQQQQPQADPVPAASATAIGLRDDAAHWREHAERLRARAAQLTDDGGRLVMLQIAETYEGLARRAAGPADGSAKD
jgi:hypothetical protein